MSDHSTAMYEFCGAFFAELKAAGVTDVVLSPGHRSAPLAVSADRASLRIAVQLDERSGAFFALGMARALRGPVALICTSGTAAANYLPAVIEANRSGVPLIVATADRPAELRGWGSNQTIDQFQLYGSATRWFAEMPVASESTPAVARRFAARAVVAAGGPNPGPVHLNFPLRSPLRPDGGVPALFAAPDRPISAAITPVPPPEASSVILDAIAEYERGVIIAGTLNPGSVEVADILEVAGAAGWPIVAEPTSQLRVSAGSTRAAVVSNGDYLVQDPEFAAEHRPDAVLLVGAAPPVRALRSWPGDACSRVIIVGDGPEWTNESFTFTDAVRFDPGAVFTAVRSSLAAFSGRVEWPETWRRADGAVSTALKKALVDAPMFEGRVVAALAEVIPDDASLFVGNSMAVRDVNTYWPARDVLIDIYSNRGASGIDGIVSSALGVAAASGRPVVALLGDVSLLHDLSGLVAASRSGLPLIVVVTNNDGGGIFSFLPIADLGDDVRFQDLFHAPHGADLGSIVSGLGIAHTVVDSSAELQRSVFVGLGASGPSVIEVRIDAAESVKTHRAVTTEVRRTLTAPQ